MDLAPDTNNLAPTNQREAGAYPLLARLLLELELLERLRAARLESLELLLLEGPLIGDPRVLLDTLLVVLLGLLALLAVVLFHLAQHLLLPQRDTLALALLHYLVRRRRRLFFLRFSPPPLVG